MQYFHVNLWAVLVAAVIQWLLGAFWYGLVVKKSWRALVGYKEGEKPKNAIFAMVSSFVASLVLSFVLAHVILWAGTATFLAGASLGVVCWLGFMAPPLFAQHIYERRPANLFAINAAYWLLAMAIGAAVLAVWH
jgi:accessory gene regulator protein AgrB